MAWEQDRRKLEELVREKKEYSKRINSAGRAKNAEEIKSLKEEILVYERIKARWANEGISSFESGFQACASIVEEFDSTIENVINNIGERFASVYQQINRCREHEEDILVERLEEVCSEYTSIFEVGDVSLPPERLENRKIKAYILFAEDKVKQGSEFNHLISDVSFCSVDDVLLFISSVEEHEKGYREIVKKHRPSGIKRHKAYELRSTFAKIEEIKREAKSIADDFPVFWEQRQAVIEKADALNRYFPEDISLDADSVSDARGLVRSYAPEPTAFDYLRERLGFSDALKQYDDAVLCAEERKMLLEARIKEYFESEERKKAAIESEVGRKVHEAKNEIEQRYQDLLSEERRMAEERQAGIIGIYDERERKAVSENRGAIEKAREEIKAIEQRYKAVLEEEKDRVERQEQLLRNELKSEKIKLEERKQELESGIKMLEKEREEVEIDRKAAFFQGNGSPGYFDMKDYLQDTEHPPGSAYFELKKLVSSGSQQQDTASWLKDIREMVNAVPYKKTDSERMFMQRVADGLEKFFRACKPHLVYEESDNCFKRTVKFIEERVS